MIYILLSILTSSSLYLVFKLFAVFKINTFQAIVFNYLIAFVCGILASNIAIDFSEIYQQEWFLGAVLLGFLFITVFNIMALTSQKNGLSVASVSSKMSVVIPVVFGILIYDESISAVKIIAIILALISVYLASVKTEGVSIEIKQLLFPILLFFGSGIIDTSLKFIEKNYVQEDTVPIFTAVSFLAAFFFGGLLLVFKLIRKQTKLETKSFLGALMLGIPNFFAIFFLIKSLQLKDFESSTLFTINNVGIVVLSTLFGLIFFKEKLLTKNWIGILLAVFSILLISIY